MQNSSQNYKIEYRDYSNYVAIMISTDRSIFIENSAVRSRMIEYSKLYKELHIIVFSKKRFDPIEISENCTIYSTNSIIRWNYVSDAVRIGKKLIRTIDKNDSMLVTCQDPFETALAGKCLVYSRKNYELLIQIHTDLFSPYFTDSRIGMFNAFINRIRLFISKFTLSHAQVIRVVSEKIADSLVEKGIDSEKIIVKPIEVDVDYVKNTMPAFDLHQKFPQFRKIVLMVSRLESEKNIEMAIKAIGIVKSKIPDTGLIVVGSGGEMARLKKMVYELKLDSNIIFEGWKTDLVPYYKGCDIFLNTSWYEGYGMVLKEAQAAGCKIISTDVGIAREVGASVTDWSAEKIADKIYEYLI